MISDIQEERRTTYGKIATLNSVKLNDNVKINFARHQHDTERTPKTAG